MAENRLLSMEQAAEYLGVSLKTIYRWIESKEFPACKIGIRTYRIFENDLVEFIKSKKITGEKVSNRL